MNIGKRGEAAVGARRARRRGLIGRKMMEALEPRVMLSGVEGEVGSLPATMEGEVAYGEGTDRYVFTAVPGVTYRFDLVEGAREADLDIRTPEGLSVFPCRKSAHCHSWDYAQDEVAEWTAVVGGLYTLRVDRAAFQSDEAPVAYRVDASVTGAADGDDHPVVVDMDVPGAIGGRIDYHGDWESFRFETVAGQLYQFRSVTGNAVVAVPVEDYLATPPCVGGAGWCSHSYTDSVTWQAWHDGTHVVSVGGINAPGDEYPQPYRVEARVADGAATADVAGAVPAAVGRTTARIDGPMETDTFRVETRGGGLYTVGATAIDGWVSQVRVFGADGVTPVSVEQYEGTVAWVSLSGGAYYVTVSGFEVGDYEVMVDEIRDDQEAMTGTLANPGSAVGVVDHSRDEDVFEFEAEIGKTYLVRLRGIDGHVYVRREGKRGWERYYTENADLRDGEGMFYLAMEGTRHLVSVSSGEYGGIGEYTISIEEAPDDQADGAGPVAIEVPARVEGRSDYPWDWDRFTFQAIAGVVYGVEADWAETDDGYFDYVRMNVFNEAGEQIWLGEQYAVWVAPEDGTYTIETMVAYPADYAFRITPNPDDVAWVRTLNWDRETSGAVGLEPEQRRWGGGGGITVQVWYERLWFVAEEGQEYLIDVDASRPFYLEDSAGNSLASGRRFRWTAPATEVYFLYEVRMGRRGSLQYQIRIDEIEEGWVDEEVVETDEVLDDEGEWVDEEEPGEEPDDDPEWWWDEEWLDEEEWAEEGDGDVIEDEELWDEADEALWDDEDEALWDEEDEQAEWEEA